MLPSLSYGLSHGIIEYMALTLYWRSSVSVRDPLMLGLMVSHLYGL